YVQPPQPEVRCERDLPPQVGEQRLRRRPVQLPRRRGDRRERERLCRGFGQRPHPEVRLPVNTEVAAGARRRRACAARTGVAGSFPLRAAARGGLAFLTTIEEIVALCRAFPRASHELRALRAEAARLRQHVALESERVARLGRELAVADATIEGPQQRVRSP